MNAPDSANAAFRPLDEADARALLNTFHGHLADAIVKTATEFLCERQNRVSERPRLVALLTDLVGRGVLSVDLLSMAVATAEELAEDPGMYQDARELLEAARRPTR